MIRRPSQRVILGSALLLPLLLFAYIWATTANLAQQGQDWSIPIRGYDPRDLLRGHFIQYRYDWPMDPQSGDQESDAPPTFNMAYVSQLCIEGTAPNISRVRIVSALEAQAQSLPGCAVIVRATVGARREVQGLDSGILFTSQGRAVSLSRKLADPQQQAFVRVKIRSDGVMRPVDLEFRQRAKR